MECYFCKGKLVPGRTTYTINRKGYHIVLDDIPALICQQCKKPFFDEKEVELMQNLIREIYKQTK
jgi:YgiT-type zinc finger domain-containing protein